MMGNIKKTLVIALGVFVVLVVAIGVVYVVRKPTTIVVSSPRPSIVATPAPSAVTAPIMQVEPADACSLSFVVACVGTPTPTPSGSATPTPTPSGSATPTPSGSPTPTPTPTPTPVAGAQLDCVVKRIYEDDGRNRAGFYYFENEILDTNLLQDGQTVVYNVVIRNTGGQAVSDTTITDRLSGNLTYLDGDSDCAYDSTSRIVTCTVGSLGAQSEAQRSFRARISVAGLTAIANTAEVTSTNGQRDSCSVETDATGKVVTPPPEAPSELPEAGVFAVTTGTLGVGLLFLILGGLGLLLI